MTLIIDTSWLFIDTRNPHNSQAGGLYCDTARITFFQIPSKFVCSLGAEILEEQKKRRPPWLDYNGLEDAVNHLMNGGCHSGVWLGEVAAAKGASSLRTIHIMQVDNKFIAFYCSPALTSVRGRFPCSNNDGLVWIRATAKFAVNWNF